VEAARAATVADVARIAALCRAFAAELIPTRGGAPWAAREARREPLDEAFASLVTAPDAHVVVGTIDGVVVGFGALHLEALDDGRRGVITELYVEPGARGVGVGEAIAEQLVAFCTAADCTGIDAWALPGQRDAKNFFEGSGFTARLLVMHRPLAP
jgi:ribosomal protein S18 acetylase RimI-like enzyme